MTQVSTRLDTSLEFAVVTKDGAVASVFDTLDEARAGLYRLPAPIGQHPRIMQRRRSEQPLDWQPVAGGLVLE